MLAQALRTMAEMGDEARNVVETVVETAGK